MGQHSIEHLKQEYIDIDIPAELDFVVRKAVKDGRRKNSSMRFLKSIGIFGSLTAAVVISLCVGVNSSPALAKTLLELPVIGDLVKVLTIKEYIFDDKSFHANIKVPEIQGLGNKDLESTLNKKYLEENKKLYDDFIKETEGLGEGFEGHLGVDSGYVIKTDTDRILSIGRYIVNTAGSSSTVFKYDTIDKEKEILITLPSLFKDDRYIDIISENIKKQMIERHEADENMIYLVDGIEQASPIDLFNRISGDQNFYINDENKLVISFNKYDVAPGSMGIVEFTIPTEKLSEILVSNEYIR